MTSFFHDLERYTNNTAILVSQTRITYQELLSVADELGSQVKQRCLVLIACTNSFSSLAGYVGFMRAGIVPLLISNKIDDQLLSKLIESYQPDYLYLPPEKSVSFQNYETVYKQEDYELKKNSFESSYRLHDDLALLLSTSGSTGSPKHVRQSYRNIESNTAAIVNYLGITEEDRAITTMPMNYTYGLSIINTHLYKGASIILTEDSLINKRFWETLSDNQATTLAGVPYIFEILKKLRFKKMDLPNLKYITQAGGKLEQELCVEFAKICTQKNIKFYIMYGQAEATARISYLPWEQVLQKPGSIGIPIPGGKIWLEDGDGLVIKEEFMAGELVYQGDNVTLGYAKNRFELQKGDENLGILYTGDLAKRDQDDYYYIVGRKKRYLKMFGNRINLDEIEQLIRSEGNECACSGIDDALKIFITEPEVENRIKKYISQKTGIHIKGFEMVVVDEIPRNDTGKILYSELDSQHGDQIDV